MSALKTEVRYDATRPSILPYTCSYVLVSSIIKVSEMKKTLDSKPKKQGRVKV